MLAASRTRYRNLLGVSAYAKSTPVTNTARIYRYNCMAVFALRKLLDQRIDRFGRIEIFGHEMHGRNFDIVGVV